MSRTNGNRIHEQDSPPVFMTPDQGGYMTGRGERRAKKVSNYYHIPLITKAHWSWEIVLYFFFGGLAGGSFLISTLAHLLDFRQDESIVRTGRYISFVSILISPILLIKDLGRPERFCQVPIFMNTPARVQTEE